MIDLLEWAVHTAAGHRDQGLEAPAHVQDHTAAVQDRGVVHEDCDRQPTEPRRSTRTGRGETIKYQDFVQNLGASTTYAQMVSGHGKICKINADFVEYNL